MRILITEQKYFRLLSESISYDDALHIFKTYSGFDVDDYSKKELRKLYRTLSLKYHPDKDSTKEEDFKKISVAYDVLSSEDIPTSSSSDSENVWSWAGYSGGTPPRTSGSDNPRDISYIKKYGWEISGRPKYAPQNEYNFMNFDGTFFRNSTYVLAIPSKLFEISEMVRNWDFHKIRAVFYRNKLDNPHNIYLINLNGQEVNPPEKFYHHSNNLNPGNDERFVEELRKRINLQKYE